MCVFPYGIDITVCSSSLHDFKVLKRILPNIRFFHCNKTGLKKRHVIKWQLYVHPVIKCVQRITVKNYETSCIFVPPLLTFSSADEELM